MTIDTIKIENNKKHHDMLKADLTGPAYRAGEAANMFTAAYWSESNRDFLISQAMTQFRSLADTLGYELTLKDEFKPQPTAMEAKAK